MIDSQAHTVALVNLSEAACLMPLGLCDVAHSLIHQTAANVFRRNRSLKGMNGMNGLVLNPGLWVVWA